MEPVINECALAIMIKTPQAGVSKTRLVPPLSHEEAAALSVSFLRDTARNISATCALQPSTGVAAYTPVGSEAALHELLPANFQLLPQRGNNFGERLRYATEDLLNSGYQSVCLIDSDSPTLPSSFLESAVKALGRPGDRVVLGAANDGGYYLIGLKANHPEVFEEIEWSTAKVLDQTVERARAANLEVQLLPAWYDVDDAQSLIRLCEELFSMNDECRAPHTRAYLQGLLQNGGRKSIWPTQQTR